MATKVRITRSHSKFGTASRVVSKEEFENFKNSDEYKFDKEDGFWFNFEEFEE